MLKGTEFNLVMLEFIPLLVESSNAQICTFPIESCSVEFDPVLSSNHHSFPHNTFLPHASTSHSILLLDVLLHHCE